MRTTTYATRALVVAMGLAAAACRIDSPTGTDLASADRVVRVPDRAAYAIEPSEVCGLFCRVGPVTFTREAGAPRVETLTFSASPGAEFVVDLDDLGSQGGAASANLNGVALLKGSERTYRETIAMQSENTLEVRLAGKPGSKLRVAIWPLQPITIDAVSLSPGTGIEIDGPPHYFQARVTNHTSTTFHAVRILPLLFQPGVERWGRDLNGGIDCGGGIGLGVLPPGVCETVPQSNYIRASNSASGHGFLTPGPASAHFSLLIGAPGYWGEFDSYLVPIVLLPPGSATSP